MGVSIMKLVVLLMLTTLTASATAWAQADAAKLADALRAGPTFITKDATILDWPSTPDGEYRVLRKGTSEWTCLPGVPGLPHDEPGCFDRVFLQWIKDGLAGRPAHSDRIGIAYMYMGAWLPHPAVPTEAPDTYFHVGPHVMVVSPHQEELQPFTRDASSGMPYINHLPKQTEVFLVIPIRAWDEKPR